MKIAELNSRARQVLVQPRTRKIAWWAGGIVAAIAVLGFFVAPPVAKSILIDKLGAALHRPVSIEKIAINPFALTAEVKGFSIKSKGGDEQAGFDSLAVNVEASSLFRGGPVIESLTLSGPRAMVTRLDDNRYDISDLIDEWSQPKPATKSPESPPPRFAVNNIRVTGGRLVLVDKPTGLTHSVVDLDVGLPFVSSMPSETAIFVQPHLSAKINGAPLLLEGRTKPFDASNESELAINLDRVNLVSYLPYSPVKLPFAVKSAMLDTELKLLFRQSAGTAPATLKLAGAVHLGDVAVNETGGSPLLAWKRLDIGLDGLDVWQKTLALGEIRLAGLEQNFRIDKSGKLNWLEMANALQGGPGKEKPAAKPAPDAAGQGKPFNLSVKGVVVDDAAWKWQEDGRGMPGDGQQLRLKRAEVREIGVDPAGQRISIAEVALQGLDARVFRDEKGLLTLPAMPEKPKSDRAPWKIAIGKASLAGSALRYEELAIKEKPVQQIDDLKLVVDNFSTEPGSKAKLALEAKINKKGSVRVGGDVQLQPLDALLDLDLTGVPILPAQPFFSEKVNITVLRGHFSGKGSLKISDSKEGIAGGFKGRLGVDDLHTIDKVNNADFLRWKTLAIGNIDTRFQPFALTVGDIALNDFYARMIVTPEGQINLSQIVRKPGDASPAAAPPAAAKTSAPAPVADVAPAEAMLVAAPAPQKDSGKATATLAKAGPDKPVAPIRIDRIKFTNGRVNFSDFFVKPNYTVNVTKINGRVNGLSSAPDSIADLELHGGYGNAAPVDVIAKLNPLAARTFLDLKAEIRGVDLTTLSTYSGKYAGYAIEKGKLSLFVTYKLENNQLSAQNRVFLDQLTFGDKVDSPDATSLPVKLAVALLKNTRGEIDINLPISGSLDDPQFSVGGVIVQVIVNLFVKAVTSPFALLGSLFGGGEELSNVEFASGQAQLTPAALKKLEALAKAMNDRPALKLEVTGRADAVADLEGAKRAAIDRAVRVEKQKDMVKKGVESASVGQIEISDKEYPEYLARVYKEAKFDKPRNLIGMQKGLPVEEMEKLLLANTTVGDDDLRQLALRRAQRVQAWLVGEGKVPMERVFVMAPKFGPDAKGEGKAQEKPEAKGEVKTDGKEAAKLSPSRVDFSLQ